MSTQPFNLCSDDAAWLDSTYAKLIERFSAECDRIGGKIPYIAEDGVYKKDMSATPEDLIWWTNGFGRASCGSAMVRPETKNTWWPLARWRTSSTARSIAIPAFTTMSVLCGCFRPLPIIA